MASAIEIGISNAKEAADQIDSHESEEACFVAYLVNAGDTAISEGLGHDGWSEAQSVFVNEYSKLTGFQH